MKMVRPEDIEGIIDAEEKRKNAELEQKIKAKAQVIEQELDYHIKKAVIEGKITSKGGLLQISTGHFPSVKGEESAFTYPTIAKAIENYFESNGWGFNYSFSCNDAYDNNHRTNYMFHKFYLTPK